MATWMNSWKRIYVNPSDDTLGILLVKKLAEILFTRENLLALLLCLILIALTIFTTDTSPTWIYQGF